jgi:hypothetical protein
LHETKTHGVSLTTANILLLRNLSWTSSPLASASRLFWLSVLFNAKNWNGFNGSRYSSRVQVWIASNSQGDRFSVGHALMADGWCFKVSWWFRVWIQFHTLFGTVLWFCKWWLLILAGFRHSHCEIEETSIWYHEIFISLIS